MPSPTPGPTRYAVIQWSYPEGARVPLGMDVVVFPVNGSVNSPIEFFQKSFTGPAKKLNLVSNTIPNGSYSSKALSGGYGCNCVVSLAIANGNVAITLNNGGDLYRIGDSLSLTLNINNVDYYAYFEVVQIAPRIVYTTGSTNSFIVAIRSVFPDGKSDWAYSNQVNIDPLLP
jgi:hypothetical protein